MEHYLDRVNYYHDSLTRFIKSSRPLMLIIGQPGAGKDQLIDQFCASTPPSQRPLKIIGDPALTPSDILKHFAQTWNLAIPSIQKSHRLQFNAMLSELRQQDQQRTLIITQAHHLSIASLAALCHLSRAQENSPVALHLILVGQVALEDNIASLMTTSPPSLLIQPLNQKETFHYIKYRLNKLNKTMPVTPSQEIMQKIYNHSGGFPSLINHLIQRWIYQETSNHSQTIEAATSLSASQESTTLFPRKKYRFIALSAFTTCLLCAGTFWVIMHFKKNSAKVPHYTQKTSRKTA